MGRSFESVRQGVKNIADHWARSSRALKKEDQQYGERLVELAKKHSSEAFMPVTIRSKLRSSRHLLRSSSARTRSNHS